MAYEKQGFVDDETLFAYQLETMEDGIIEAQNTANKALEQGGSAEIPVFDLGAMGMGAIELSGGGSQAIETDTAELWAALDKGAVTFGLPIIMGGNTITGYVTMHSFTDAASLHQCVGTFINNDIFFVMVVVQEGMIAAGIVPLSSLIPEQEAETPPTAVDLSNYDGGTIVETYADGTSKTTTIEFDADGNPIKITDSDGNVTVLTW